MICPFPLNLPGKGNVPCGKCYACLTNKRNEWDFRLLQEAANAASSYFVTLTYDNDHLPKNSEVNSDHLRNFFKRMRNRGIVFKYYAVAEYGEKRGRPHYHFLFFSPNAVSHYDMELHVGACWSYGRTHIGDLSTKSVHYVTKWHIHPKTERHGFHPSVQGSWFFVSGEFEFGVRCPGECNIRSSCLPSCPVLSSEIGSSCRRICPYSPDL